MTPLPEPALTAFHAPGAGDYFTAAQMLAYGEACRQEERERCVRLIETHQVPVGNSRAGEMAAEWTLDALRDVRERLKEKE